MLTVARGLAPVRLRSSRSPVNTICLNKRMGGRFAAQRGQAPSPQVFGSQPLAIAEKPLSFATASAIQPGRRFVLRLPLETL